MLEAGSESFYQAWAQEVNSSLDFKFFLMTGFGPCPEGDQVVQASFSRLKAVIAVNTTLSMRG